MSDGSAVSKSFSSSSSGVIVTTMDGDDACPYANDSFADDASLAIYSDGDVYAEDSFVVDESDDLPAHVREPERARHGDATEVDAYENDSFEENDGASESDKYEDSFEEEDAEYSADYCCQERAPNDESNSSWASPALETQSLATDCNAGQSHTCDQFTQHPTEDFDAVAKGWTTTMVKKLLVRHERAKHSRPATTRAPLHMDVERIKHEVVRRLQESQPLKHPKRRSDRVSTVRVPTALVERARVRRAIAVASAFPPLESFPRTDPRSLSTFFVTKTADLQGKLATQRLDDMCSKWHTDGDSYSVGVLEFMASTARRRREILGDDASTKSGLSCLKTQATGLERAAQMAQSAIEDSHSLVEQARRVIGAHDASPCTCDFSPCS